MNLSFIFLYLFLLISSFSISLSALNEKYVNCSKALECGTLGQVSYPFYDGSTRPDYCGYPGFKVSCDADPQITISKRDYYLRSTDNDVITVSRTDKWESYCPDGLTNTTIDFSIFNFSSSDQNITFFYNCGDNTGISSLTATCAGLPSGSPGYYLTQEMLKDDAKQSKLSEVCESNLFLPILESEAEKINNQPQDIATLISALEAGFELEMKTEIVRDCDVCKSSGGGCGYDWSNDKFVCYCADANHDTKCFEIKGNRKHWMFILAASLAALGIVGIIILFSYYILRKRKPAQQNVEDLLKNYASLVPRRYTYAEIRKMTCSLREKLGEGGYGAVYKGKLQDGRVVAVKLLKRPKGDGNREFINEVVSTYRTNHINVIRLLGFCFEGRKQALVYEFMPNGSLEKYISRNKNSHKNNQILSFEKLFEIAVGVASGLEYLHRGCDTRILHFDIKPHNILLDSKFIPKISDFGLAKSCIQEKSIVSLSGARGTAGYIAPELVLRNFGGISHKSDVYSYGMMVLDMAGCRKNVDESVEASSESYFPRWIYKQLEEETGTDGNTMKGTVEELERKMILVGLWCIQTNPSDRPPMRRVVEMLQGNVELLEVPPVPSLSSPAGAQPLDSDSSGLLSATIQAN